MEPKIDFGFHAFETHDEVPVVIMEIQSANHTPVRFDAVEYIRIGSYKKPLGKHPEKERALWRIFDKKSFEYQLAMENVSVEQVLKLLDYPAYFNLVDLPLPEGRDGILLSLEADSLIQKNTSGLWDITNQGAILFSRELKSFRYLARKAVRLILYKGNDRCQTIRELPAPIFETYQNHTRVVLFAHREFKEMDTEERVRAAYLPQCVALPQPPAYE